MSRLLIYSIATSQLFGAIWAFASVDARVKQAPLSGLGATEIFFLAITIAVYLLGLVGAISILAGKRWGFSLSVIHQIVLIPVILIANSFRWILEDAASLVAFAVQKADSIGGQLVGTLGTYDILSTMQPQPETNYFGINLIALFFAIYLSVAKKNAGLLGARPGENVSLVRLLIHAIGFLQVVTALLAFSAFSETFPLGATWSSPDRAIALSTIGVYLLGFIGGIFLLQGWRLGVFLSIIHQLLCMPILVLAAQKIGYVFVSIVNVVVAYVIDGDKHTFAALYKIGADLQITFPSAGLEPTIIGINLFALLCAVYLYATRARLRAPAPVAAPSPSAAE